jgi:hypothetical protein
MEELGMVLEGRLIESAYDSVLFAAHSEKGKAHARRKTMIIEDHSKGSGRGHERSSQNRFDKRLVEIEVQLEVLEEVLQRNEEDQRYGWTL